MADLDDLTEGVPTEVALARGLLQIANSAMPESYFWSDSRCKLAREVLRRNGLEAEVIEQ